MIKIKYASLINIVADKEVIPEYLQNDCTAENLADGLLKILDDPKKASEQVKLNKKALQDMGFGSKLRPSSEAAKVIGSYVNN